MSRKRNRHVCETDDEVAKCKDCSEEKPVLWDCNWDASHLICSDCAASCNRCGKYYCDDCCVVLVFCDSCDAIFCPDCKPRVCVCAIPRVATCFMVDFKKRTYNDVVTELRHKKAKRQISDSTVATGQTSATAASKESASIEEVSASIERNWIYRLQYANGSLGESWLEIIIVNNRTTKAHARIKEPQTSNADPMRYKTRLC